jgi:hypothetical protein
MMLPPALLLLFLPLEPSSSSSSSSSSRSSSAAGAGAWQQRKAARLRSLGSRAHPADLIAAQQLHAELAGRSRAIGQVYGHQVPSSTPNLYSLLALSSSATTSPLISPTSYGADPTGLRDSTQSMSMAVAAVLDSYRGRNLSAPVKDLGGATLDLLGGTYLVSEPLVFPSGFGNFQVVSGTIRASAGFPGGRFLLEVGSDNPHNYKNGTSFCYPGEHQNICNEDINIQQLFLDASHVASGGLSISKTMGATVSTVFVYGFVDAGIRVDGGHEAMITEAWAAEYYWDETFPQDAHGIGIELNCPDSVLTNVIIFSHAKVGVLVGWTPRAVDPAGQAGNRTAEQEWAGCNILEGVHVWPGGPTTVGIQMDGPRNRLVNSYVDNAFLNVSNPNSLTVTNTLFLNSHSIWNVDGGYDHVQNVHYRDNMCELRQPALYACALVSSCQRPSHIVTPVPVHHHSNLTTTTLRQMCSSGRAQSTGRRSTTRPASSSAVPVAVRTIPNTCWMWSWRTRHTYRRASKLAPCWAHARAPACH